MTHAPGEGSTPDHQENAGATPLPPSSHVKAQKVLEYLRVVFESHPEAQQQWSTALTTALSGDLSAVPIATLDWDEITTILEGSLRGRRTRTT